MSPSIADAAISSTGGSVEQIHPDRRLLLRSTTAKREGSQRLDAQCEICKQLKPQHLGNAEDQDIPRPSAVAVPTKHVRRNAQHCPVCRLLARYCFARYAAHPFNYDPESSVDLQSNPDLVRRLVLNESFEVSFLADAGGERIGRRLSVTMLPESTGYTFDDVGPNSHIFPVGHIMSQLSTFNCRLIDWRCIDLPVVRLWLSRSEEKRKTSYENIHGVNTKANQVFWTIDVPNKRLRRTSTSDRFVALSYVLGDTTVSPFVATAEEFFTLVDKGTSLQDALEQQPRTIADAMLVVLDIGETLLWVDALCMPPSAKHRAGQIAFMDQIFGSATLTIIAANGNDANCGLSGVRSGTRALDQIVDQVGPSLALAVELPHTIDAVTKAPWNNQGWTYQERLLSKRLLIFADETIFWQRKSLFTGDDRVLVDRDENKDKSHSLKLNVDRVTPNESPQHSRQFRMQGDELFDNSYFWEYTDVVEEYTKRNLTLDSDMLAAFSGLSRGFAWAWKTDLLWGLPENRIDAALLWEKDFSSDRNPHFLRRRPTSVRFPSWTWAGWKGAVKYQPGTFGATKVEYIRPCVGWFALKNGKLNLLDPTTSFHIPEDTIEGHSSQFHRDPQEENFLHLKALSVTHQVPADFCFTNQMLYGYTTVAPIVHFIDYLVETTSMRLARVSRNDASTKKGRKLGRSVQFRNQTREVTGGAELNGDGPYDADEIDLVLLSERRRIDRLKATDLSLGYKVMLVKWDRNRRTATRVGLGRVDQRVWWNASPNWREVTLT